MNPQAERLNKQLSEPVLSLLSKRGKAIFFPSQGILAQSADAKGKRLNATIGAAIEDDGSPMSLPSITGKISLPAHKVFPYAPSFGLLALRKAWQELLLKKNPSLAGASISLPVVTNALTHGLSMVGYLFLDEGDEIILADKFWGNYRLVFEHAYGVKLKTFNTFVDGKFDIAALKERLAEKTGKKVLLLNFPNNPTGYTPTEAEAEKILAVIKECAETGEKLLVICDDAYFGLVYEEGILQESLFAKLASLHENVLAVKVDGATKEDYVWGFRVGFLTFGGKTLNAEACAALEAKTAGAVRGNISSAPHLSQSLVLGALESESYAAEKAEKKAVLKSRYDAVRKVFDSMECEDGTFFTPLPFNSGYFMCIELAKGLDAEAVRKRLLEKYDTGVIAIANLLRIAYSSVAATDIPELFTNIQKACEDVGDTDGN